MSAYKHASLRERAALFSQLVREPGWELLQRSFRPEIRTRVTDQDAREAFLYEAIRSQVIQEIFSTPYLVMQQADREWARQSITKEEQVSFTKAPQADRLPEEDLQGNHSPPTDE